MNVSIRKATLSQVPTISLLGKQTFTETFGHLFRDPQDLANYLQRTFSTEKISQSFNNPTNVFWVAYLDEIPVGYGKLKLHESDGKVELPKASQLQKIYVVKEHLSKKIGLQLQEEMLKEAKNSDSQFIWLSVLKENERAIRFYEKNGFQRYGEHDFQIGKELFHFDIMTKEL